jgi:hypothetical protein
MNSASSVFCGTLAVTFALCTAGCGILGQSAPKSASVATQPTAAAPKVALQQAPEGAPQRRVGDFFVHRFSGSFSSEPLTLTEEVKSQQNGAWVVDFSLTQDAKVERLRVRFDVATGEPTSVARLDGSNETPAKLQDYEVLMARTVFTADVNDGLVSSNAQTCLVGEDALDCDAKTYKVWVGEAPATLAVMHSAAFADRDVSGEITTDDGKLIYRAELVEARAGKPASGVATR